MLDKGPHYGLGKDGETQASTAVGGTQQPESTADPLPPAERLAALDMAINNLEQANRDDDHALSKALLGTDRALQTRGTGSPGGTLSCRLTGTTCFGLASSTFLQVTPLLDLGRSAVFRTAARYPATVAADGLTVCATEVRPAGLSTFLMRLAVVRTHAISPLCGRFRAFCRARPAPQSEPSCLMPAVSHYSQVPDVGLGHSRRWRKIPRSEPVCPHSVLWWSCRMDTPAPRQKGLLVPDLGAPSGRLSHDCLRSISGLRQVQAATLMRPALSAGDDQAGPRTALLPMCHNHVFSRPLGPGRVFKCSCVCPACSVAINLTPLTATASRVVSSQLLVALHTALARVEPSYAEMPSPSAKLKASRRLPKRLLVTWPELEPVRQGRVQHKGPTLLLPGQASL